MEKPIENLIQHLSKQTKKIISQDKLQELVYLSFWENTPISKIYKLTYQLKNRWILYPLRKELFYISTPDSQVSQEEIEEKRYWKILKEHCNNISKQRYIWWLVALEINLHGNWVTTPEDIIIVNKEKQTSETIMFDKSINFKKYEIKWKSLLPILIKQTNNTSIQNSGKLLVANLELSIIESLYNTDITDKWYTEECIKKAIKKNWKSLNLSVLETIIKQWKHNTSLNRLYNITKSSYPTLAEEIKKLVKKYWFVL